MKPGPIFIVGSGRSGTSVLTWAIGQHPNVHVVPETYWITAIASHLHGLHKIGGTTDSAHFSRYNVEFGDFAEGLGYGIDRIARESFRKRFPSALKPKGGMSYLRSEDEPKQRWVDGTPANSPYASVIAQIFPEAKFIHLIRHPEDVFRSWAGLSWRAPEFKKPIALLKHIYHSQRSGYLAEAAFMDRSMRLFYTDMVRQPERTMKPVARFIGEDYSPFMAEPLLADKINSSGATKPQVDEELKSVINSDLMETMRYWYDQASDDTWQISEPDDAARALAEYANHKIPL